MILGLRDRRPGLSLLEVLVALSIFLFSLIAIGQLITLSGEIARDVQQQGMAAQMAQSKMAEVNAGALALTSVNDSPFDDDPDWQWSMDVTADSTPGLNRVEVRVFRSRSDGSRVESKLSQIVLDPSIRGSASDAASAATTTTTTDPNATGSTTGSATGTGATSTTGGGATTGATGQTGATGGR